MTDTSPARTSRIVEPLQPLAIPAVNLMTDPENARRGDVAAVKRSLNVFGQRKPIVVKQTGTDADGRPTGIIMAGNHTYAAALELGWTEVAAVFVDDDAATAKAYALADNRTGELASWDQAQLAATLQTLSADEFDMTALGWSETDLATLLGDPGPVGGDGSGESTTDDEPVAPPADPITQPGEVWLLGPHRIICGDCRDADTVARLLDGARVNLAFTSPPYADRRTYDESSGFRPIPPAEYVEWFRAVAENVRAHLAEDGSWFVNIKEHCEDGQRLLYVKDLTLAHVRKWGWRFVDELCWVDTHNGIPDGWPNRFKDAWEPIFHYSLSKIKFNPLANGTETARTFDYSATRPKSPTGSGLLGVDESAKRDGIARPSNVIHLPAAAGEASGLHSAPFPVGLPAWFVRAYTDPGDAVYDPFMGSGSTLLAAHNHERVAYGCEISPGYVDVICARFQRASGIKPVRASTGEPIDFNPGAG